MDKVHFAIVGCGVIAHFHATAISQIPEAQLVGVFDEYRPGAERFVQALVQGMEREDDG